MTDKQKDAVLEILKRIAADQTEMRRDLESLVRRVARIEERLGGSDERLRRIERRLAGFRRPWKGHRWLRE
jgi:hypothetical protein